MQKMELPPGWRRANLPTSRQNSATTDGVGSLLRAIAGSVGLSVGAGDALALNTVWACVQCLADSLKMLPIKLVKQTDDGSIIQERHNLSNLLRFPNAEMTGADMKAAIGANLALHGNALLTIVRNNRGDVVELVPVPWSLVRMERDTATNRLKYKIHNAVTRATETLDFARVIHIRGGITFDGINSAGANSGIARVLEIARAIDLWSSLYYANGGNPTFVIESANKLSTDQIAQLKEQWSARISTPGASAPFVLTTGQTAKMMSNTARDSQTTETRREQDLAICRVFRVPPHKVGIFGDTTSASVEQKQIDFVQSTIGPMCAGIEAAFGALLTRAEQTDHVFKFNLHAFLRGDTAAQSASFAVGRQGGWMSANDIRDRLDMPHIDGGDTYLEPLNMRSAGDGASGNPGTQTTRMNSERFAFLNGGFNASLLHYQAQKALDKRTQTRKALEHTSQRWAEASRLKIKNEKPANELRLYGSIGYSCWGDECGTSHSDVQKWLDSQSGDICVKINSPGGDVFEGNGIHSALTAYAAKGRKVEIVIEALAASIASVIATAGTNVKIAANALIMVHRAWTYTAGNADDLKKEAEVLTKIDGTITSAYAAFTGLEKKELDAMLEAETWMTAEEAKAQGFAHEVIGETEIEPEPEPEPEPAPPEPDTKPETSPSNEIPPETTALLDRLWARFQ